MSNMRNDRPATPSPMDNTLATQPFWSLLEQGIQRTEPVVRSTVAVQLATLTLVGNRARAQLDLASKLTACRTPLAAMEATTAFWQDAARQYMSFAQQCTRAWGGAYASALAPMPTPGPVRDMLTVPDVTATKPGAVRDETATKRRAA